jgi:putative ATP-grasp target RiPP
MTHTLYALSVLTAPETAAPARTVVLDAASQTGVHYDTDGHPVSLEVLAAADGTGTGTGYPKPDHDTD